MVTFQQQVQDTLTRFFKGKGADPTASRAARHEAQRIIERDPSLRARLERGGVVDERLSALGKLARGGQAVPKALLPSVLKAKAAEQLMTTRKGIVDIGTGKVIAPIGTSTARAIELARQQRIAAQRNLQIKQAEELRKQQDIIRQQLPKKETTIFVGGKGFTVRKQDQPEFIRKQLSRGRTVQVDGKRILPKIGDKVKLIPDATSEEFKKRTITSINFVKEVILPKIDLVTGRFFEQNKKQNELNKLTLSLNKDIENFNKKYSGRELFELEFNEAQIEENKINKKISNLENLEKQIEEIKYLRFKTSKEAAAKIKIPQNLIKIWKILKVGAAEQKKLREEGKLATITAFDPSAFSKATAFVFRTLGIKVSEAQEDKLKSAFFVALPELRTKTKILIKFLGQQKTVDGKIITDIAFSSGGKRVGLAKGFTIQKGKISNTLSIGRVLKGKKITPKVVEKIRAGKGQLFTGIEKALSKKDLQQISNTFQLPRNILLQLLKKNKKLNKLFKLRQLIQKQLDRINLLLKQFKGTQKFIKIKAGIKFSKNNLLIRKRNIQSKLNSLTRVLKNELKQFKGITRAKKIKVVVNLRRNSLIIRKHRLQNQINSLTQTLKNELLQFKGITRAKKIKKGVRFRINSLSIRSRNIQAQLKKVIDELKKFKGITRAKKIKAGTKFRINALKIRKQNLNKQLNKISKALKNELLQFKGITRVKKIREGLKFRINSLIIRRQNLNKQLNKIISNILPKRVELIVTKNLKKITQVSAGKVKLGKGTKDVDDVFSIANIFNSDDISKIVGKTITKKGDLIEFTGLVKNLDKDISSLGRGLTQIQKKSYEKALEEVMKVAGSTIKTNKIRALSKPAQSIVALNTVKPIPPTKLQPVIEKVKVITAKVKPTPKIIRSVKPERVIGGIKPLQKQQMEISSQVRQLKLQSQSLDSRIKQTQRQLQKGRLKLKQKQRLKQRLKQLQKLKIKSKLKLRTRLQLLQKQKQKLKAKLKLKVPITIKTPKKKIAPFKLIIPKGFKKKTLSKKVIIYLVREKVRNKIITLSPKPLTFNDAVDFAAFRIDKRLSRSSFFEPMGMSKNVVSLPKHISGYFRKHSKKFRKYKIKVGKKKAIRNGIIERKAFIGDTKSEIKLLQAEKRKARKRVKRIVKKKVVKRRVKKKRIKKVGKKSTKRKIRRRKTTRRRIRR